MGQLLIVIEVPRKLTVTWRCAQMLSSPTGAHAVLCSLKLVGSAEPLPAASQRIFHDKILGGSFVRSALLSLCECSRCLRTPLRLCSGVCGRIVHVVRDEIQIRSEISGAKMKKKKELNSNKRKDVTINNIKVEVPPVHECAKYLGQTITFQQQETTEIRSRIRAAWASFYRYKQELTSKSYSLQHKVRFFNTVITPTLTLLAHGP